MFPTLKNYFISLKTVFTKIEMSGDEVRYLDSLMHFTNGHFWFYLQHFMRLFQPPWKSYHLY